MREGLSGDPVAETLVFYHDERDRARLVALAPTRAVRLVRTAARRPDRIAEILAALAADEQIRALSLRRRRRGNRDGHSLACRTDGAVLTDA